MATANTGALDQNNPYGTTTNTSQPPTNGTTPPPTNPNGTGTTPPAAPPTFDQINQAYETDLGRAATPQEYQNFWDYSTAPGATPQDWQTDWSATIASSPEAQAYAAGKGGATTGNVGQSTAPTLANTGSLSGSAQAGDLVSQLVGIANQSLNINPTTDPVIAPQVNDYEAQQTRTARNLIDQSAEGGNPYATGSLQNTRTQAAEAAGQNTANLQSQLTQNELTARRAQVQNALSEQGSMLTAEQQSSLQQELGLLDASLNQQNINSNNSQFAASLGLQTDNQNNYWDALRNGLITQ